MVLEVIVKYWLQFFLGILASGLTALCTYFYTLYKKEKQKKKSEAEDRFIGEVERLITDNNHSIMKIIRDEELASKKADVQSQEQMEQIKNDLIVLTEGMLSIQGKQFKDECRVLLKEGHVISLQEYENITNEHRIYNALKGNHEGDSLYGLVKVKYEAGLAKSEK